MKLLLVRVCLLTVLTFFCCLHSFAQCGVPTYQFGTTTALNHSVINLPCGQTCTDIKYQTPHIKSTDNYTVSSIAYNPFTYVTSVPGLTVVCATTCSNQDD